MLNHGSSHDENNKHIKVMSSCNQVLKRTYYQSKEWQQQNHQENKHCYTTQILNLKIYNLFPKSHIYIKVILTFIY